MKKSRLFFKNKNQFAKKKKRYSNCILKKTSDT